MKSIKMVVVGLTKCPDLDGVMCTIPIKKDEHGRLCIMCEGRIEINKCPRGETLENVTVTHYLECPQCGADLR